MLIKGITVNLMLNILWVDHDFLTSEETSGACWQTHSWVNVTVYFWPHIHTHMCALSFPRALCEGCCGANGNEVPSCVPAVAPSYTQWPLCVCGGTILVASQCDFTFYAYSNLLHGSLENLKKISTKKQWGLGVREYIYIYTQYNNINVSDRISRSIRWFLHW